MIDLKTRREVVRLYKSGMSQREIAKTLHIGKATVRRIAIDEGIYVPNRGDILTSKEYKERALPRMQEFVGLTSEYTDMRTKLAITQEEINRVRSQTKIGSLMYVRTLNGAQFDDNGNLSKQCVRLARVINTNNPRFCIVRFVKKKPNSREFEDGCITEAIMWTDIAKTIRTGATYVQ